MYDLIVYTKYNTINLIIDDYNSPEVHELLDQPYIIGVELHKIKNKIRLRSKRDEMERNKENETR